MRPETPTAALPRLDMLARFLVLAGGLLAAGLAPAADLAKIDRSIKKEPAYRAKQQRYCLLVFGPKADFRVWLVLDGATLYVDRNGNGDLTEPGESTGPKETNTDPCSFKELTIVRPDGKEEKLDFALFGWFDYKEGKEGTKFGPSVGVTWEGRTFGSWGDETGDCVWGRTPKDAPILHVGGPLQMGFETEAEYALDRKGDGEFKLSVGVGTKGLGKGAFMHLCYYDDAIPKDKYPTAVLEFPNKEAAGKPIVVKAVLKQRC
jgi:hypothetical protein